MTTEVWRDFDPNLDVPAELQFTRLVEVEDVTDDYEDIDFQDDTLADDDSDLDDDVNDEELGVPASFSIVSQTVRTGPDGSQVVDVVIDIEDIDAAVNYEVRITK